MVLKFQISKMIIMMKRKFKGKFQRKYITSVVHKQVIGYRETLHIGLA